MFKERVPEGQPRSLRSIAESNAAPGSLDGAIPYNAQAGMPASEVGANDKYKDAAQDVSEGKLPDRVDIAKPFTIRKG